jgi:GAF domain-containing protein
VSDARATVDDLPDPFAELGRLVLGNQPLPELLAQVAELAKQLMPSGTEVSVTLVQGEHATTPAFTGQVAKDLDETQYAYGFGPCLSAAEGAANVQIHDTANEDRAQWQPFAQAAHGKGVRSTLSVGLPVQQRVIGALNVYSPRPDAFDEQSVELMELFAAHAAVAVANAALFASATHRAEQLQIAMASRAVIEQAKGILMAQRRCTAEEAFDVLVVASQRANKKLREIATAIVESVHEPTA